MGKVMGIINSSGVKNFTDNIHEELISDLGLATQFTVIIGL